MPRSRYRKAASNQDHGQEKNSALIGTKQRTLIQRKSASNKGKPSSQRNSPSALNQEKLPWAHKRLRRVIKSHHRIRKRRRQARINCSRHRVAVSLENMSPRRQASKSRLVKSGVSWSGCKVSVPSQKRWP